MKTILFLLLITTISCKSQIFPLNTNLDDVPYNGYIKDLDNELDKYVGIWVGNWNGKTLSIEFKKVKDHRNHPQYPYYKDRIFGERKVVSSNGVVEIDRITNFDFDSPEIRGPFRSYSGEEKFLFSPKNMCRKRVSLYIKSFTTTQMTLHFEYEPSYYDADCQHNAYEQQYGDFPVNFPKDIVLTKQ
ncbi:DUF6705 family protein [Frigoriflavimonas asaccharolytica]|uniref:DUF6705 domain-containing protein n=1 Tax=Frigoriflavimonas asaccharolytica TaxID=2735899 RepID=A0A8J8G9V4_9FLAO|nr:DUF6705 family protein [Frigoriflavimonas asaccharolytica]NRS92219.1 hypothetical protein [Frigoriflavimonas asaccharolytica]